jgi:hypothetical protein
MFAGKGFSSPGLVTGALLYQGAIDASGSPNYPAANSGDMYIISVAGKIGGASGLVVSAGDLIVCTTDLTPAGTQAAVGSYWNIIQANIDLTNISVTGGTINGTTIGGTTPAAGTFNTLKGTTLNSVVSGWVQTIGTFTAAPASTSTITMTTDLTATILVGYPLKYTIGGTTYYGIVSAIAANLLTVNGAPLGGDVTALYYGDPLRVIQMQVMIPSTYEDASNTDLIGSDLKTKLIWDKAKAYLVRFKVYSNVEDTSDNGQASVQINNTETCTTAGGLTIAAAQTWYSTVVDIATAAYDINPGEELEVTCIKGTTGDATDLTVKMIFIIP